MQAVQRSSVIDKSFGGQGAAFLLRTTAPHISLFDRENALNEVRHWVHPLVLYDSLDLIHLVVIDGAFERM